MAAAQSLPEAQYSCGWCSFKGLGTPRDYVEARHFFEQAANNGNIPAKRMLGYIYMNGLGTAEDRGKAAEWFEKAALRKDKESGKMLAVCLKYGGNYLTKDEAKARKLADEFGFGYDTI